MRLIRPLLALACAALAAAACFSDEPAPATSVALKLLPPNGGTAYIAIDTMGKIMGGHASGGDAPTVREDTASIPRADAAAIFADVRALGDTLLSRTPGNFDEPPGSTEIAVLFGDGSQARIVWPTDRPHPDARVNALAAKLLGHRTPSW